jgi:hypothetical protein
LNTFLDIHHISLNKQGEELCGDKVKILKTPEKTTIVLSDGLGSGVKANILASLTTEIIITMLRENTALKDVIETVIGTLPVCKVRKIAYATFTIVEIRPQENFFTVINFDNPPVYFLKQGKIIPLLEKTETISKKKIKISTGTLEKGDFLGVASDGILYAGLGTTMNLGWGWDNIARYIEDVFAHRVYAAHSVVNSVVTKTRMLYADQIGDDATFVGVFVRNRNSLIVFTGPPLDEGNDHIFVNKLLDYPGRKVVCGGTTGNIVAGFLKEKVVTDMSTLRPEVPPIGKLSKIDLVTEGIVTLARTLENLKACEGDLSRLVPDRNGAYLLTRELILADEIFFLVGQQINTVYHSPLLPSNISVRRNLIEQIAAILSELTKDVKIEYC